jgi:hypothetical protein
LASKSIGNGRGAGGNPAATHDEIKTRNDANAYKCRTRRNITRSYLKDDDASLITKMRIALRKKSLVEI